MMLYGRELETPLDLITRPSGDGVDEPGVPYPETLRASMHDQTGATLDHSHNRQKHNYDLRRRQTTYAVGPLRVSQKLGDVNYRPTGLDTGMDAGFFHVVNLQPFNTWDSPSSSRRTIPVTAEQSVSEALDNDMPTTQGDESHTDIAAADMFHDTPAGFG
ncbi:uncharacterized protein LOC113017360 [Scomber scombrus]|uniref:Uncharacterized protein LOC113017360 n=1 Tax=Scomber scombrus TaxID=13677 RepID=A0AAV1Q0Y3_SCOSC